MVIKLVPHDPAWGNVYRRAATDIRRALGKTALSVNHVGSTAIPGIVAKPVIDVLVLVEGLDPEAPYRAPLVSLGYAFGHRDEGRVFFEGFPAGMPVQVHVVEESSVDSWMMMTFRDYLRAHPEEASPVRRPEEGAGRTTRRRQRIRERESPHTCGRSCAEPQRPRRWLRDIRFCAPSGEVATARTSARESPRYLPPTRGLSSWAGRWVARRPRGPAGRARGRLRLQAALGEGRLRSPPDADHVRHYAPWGRSKSAG